MFITLFGDTYVYLSKNSPSINYIINQKTFELNTFEFDVYTKPATSSLYITIHNQSPETYRSKEVYCLINNTFINNFHTDTEYRMDETLITPITIRLVYPLDRLLFMDLYVSLFFNQTTKINNTYEDLEDISLEFKLINKTSNSSSTSPLSPKYMTDYYYKRDMKNGIHTRSMPLRNILKLSNEKVTNSFNTKHNLEYVFDNLDPRVFDILCDYFKYMSISSKIENYSCDALFVTKLVSIVNQFKIWGLEPVVKTLLKHNIENNSNNNQDINNTNNVLLINMSSKPQKI